MKKYFDLLTSGIQDPRVLKQTVLMLIYLVIGAITGIIINITKGISASDAIWSGMNTIAVLGLAFCVMIIFILAPLVEHKKRKKYEKDS